MSDKSISSGWEKLAESIWMFRDSCNVYAVAGPEGLLVINAGTGRWLDELGGLPGPVKALACTHFFRDHFAGAAEAARRGIAVYAPYWEQEQFADPLGLFQRRRPSSSMTMCGTSLRPLNRLPFHPGCGIGIPFAGEVLVVVLKRRDERHLFISPAAPPAA